MSRWSGVCFKRDSADPSPANLPSYKLVGVPSGVAKKWRDRLDDLGCCGLFTGAERSGLVTIYFWASELAIARLSAAFPADPVQLSLV